MIVTLKVNSRYLDITLGREEDASLAGPVEGNVIHYVHDASLKKHFFENDFPPDIQRTCCRILASFWHLFHPPAFSLDLPAYLTPLPSEETPTFFTGSFDPWHEGHTRCIQLAGRNIIIAPDNNPWKNGKLEKSSPFKTLQGIPSNLFHEIPCSLFTGFLGKNEANPTAQWITRLKTRRPAFIVGDDNFLSLEKWHNAELFLRSISKLIVVPRLASDKDVQKQKAKLAKMAPDLVMERREHHDCEHIASSTLKA